MRTWTTDAVAWLAAGVMAVAWMPLATAMNEHDGAVVAVTGTGVVSRTPDRAVVRVGASAQADEAGEAQERVNRVLARTIANLKVLGVAGMNIQTQSIQLNPVYDRTDRNSPRITGYRASNVVSVRIDDVSAVGKVIDSAVKSGANQLMGVSFQLRDNTPEQAEALKRAVAQARLKAEAIASAMGGTLSGAVEVVEQGVSSPVFRQELAGRAMAMDVGAPVETGQLQVTATVHIRYEIEFDDEDDDD